MDRYRGIKGVVIIRVLLSFLFLIVMVGHAWPQAAPLEQSPSGPKLDEQVIVDKMPTPEETVRTIFSEIERRIIDRYFGKEAEETDKKEDQKGWKKIKAVKVRGKSKELPPGLAKRATLPPGLARHVQHHGTLPPGIQKRNLPDDLRALLPNVASGQDRVIVDDDVVLIEQATGLILDVIENVIIRESKGGSGASANGSKVAS